MKLNALKKKIARKRRIEMNIILYSTHCPQCKVLEQALDTKKIEYQLCTDLTEMQKKGFKTVPQLEVDGTIMDLKEAFNWVKEY